MPSLFLFIPLMLYLEAVPVSRSDVQSKQGLSALINLVRLVGQHVARGLLGDWFMSLWGGYQQGRRKEGTFTSRLACFF